MKIIYVNTKNQIVSIRFNEAENFQFDFADIENIQNSVSYEPNGIVMKCIAVCLKEFIHCEVSIGNGKPKEVFIHKDEFSKIAIRSKLFLEWFEDKLASEMMAMVQVGDQVIDKVWSQGGL